MTRELQPGERELLKVWINGIVGEYDDLENQEGYLAELCDIVRYCYDERTKRSDTLKIAIYSFMLGMKRGKEAE